MIEKARIKNSTPKEKLRRKRYKKTQKGKEAERRYYQRHIKEIRKRSHGYRLKSYGITEPQLAEMLVKQRDMCAICSKKLDSKYHIDHSHKEHKVRGLLCNSCNMGLGLFKDNPELLLLAIEYLIKNGTIY